MENAWNNQPVGFDILSTIAIICIYGRLIVLLLGTLAFAVHWQKTGFGFLTAFFVFSLVMGGVDAPTLLLATNVIGALTSIGYLAYRGIQRLMSSHA